MSFLVAKDLCNSQTVSHNTWILESDYACQAVDKLVKHVSVGSVQRHACGRGGRERKPQGRLAILWLIDAIASFQIDGLKKQFSTNPDEESLSRVSDK